MNKLIRLVGVAFIVLSVFSASLLYISSVNYLNVTETRLTLPRHIRISEVRIPRIADESKDVTVQVLFNISNPSKLAIVVTSIESHFYMDNKSDPRSFSEKKEDVWVGLGQFTLPKDKAYVVLPGETRTIPVNMTVFGGTMYISVLNTTDQGRYYPIIDGRVYYTFEEFDLVEKVWGVVFNGNAVGGVEPYGS
ncbi:MAG: hypothetical protein ACE5KV_02450 [Thermoplasmata archaeon]